MDGVKADTLEFRSVWHYRIFNRIFCIPIYVLTFVFRLLISVRDKAVCSNLYHFIHIAIWVLVLSSARGYTPGPCLFSGRAFAIGSTLLLKGIFLWFLVFLEYVLLLRKIARNFWGREWKNLTHSLQIRDFAVVPSKKVVSKTRLSRARFWVQKVVFKPSRNLWKNSEKISIYEGRFDVVLGAARGGADHWKMVHAVWIWESFGNGA